MISGILTDAIGPPRGWLAAFAAATLFGLLLGFLGPFGSYLNGGLSIRLGYWAGVMWLGTFIFGAGVVASARLARGRPRLGWALMAASVLFGSIPQTLLTRAFAFRLWPALADFDLSVGEWYLQVVAIGLLTVFGSQAVIAHAARRSAAGGAPERHSQASADEWLSAGRLRARFGNDIVALKMEDHYVRVHTATGSSLLLMPLARAIAAAAPIEGMRTHRSWWVARHAVVRVEGTSRAMALHLSNGLVAPISRHAVARLRAAGWLAGERPAREPVLLLR